MRYNLNPYGFVNGHPPQPSDLLFFTAAMVIAMAVIGPIHA